MRLQAPPRHRSGGARRSPVTIALVAVFVGVAALVVYGLFAWENIVRRRRAAEPSS